MQMFDRCPSFTHVPGCVGSQHDVRVQMVPASAGAQGPQVPAQPVLQPVVVTLLPQWAAIQRLQEWQRLA